MRASSSRSTKGVRMSVEMRGNNVRSVWLLSVSYAAHSLHTSRRHSRSQLLEVGTPRAPPLPAGA